MHEPRRPRADITALPTLWINVAEDACVSRRALVAPDQELTREFFEHLVNLGPGPGRACLVFRGEQILDDLIDKQVKKLP